jgi:GNAT superfamily N-acetyltransferase
MSALDNPDLPPDALIAMLVASLWTGIMAGREANVCVDACRILQHAYGQFGMRSELQAVELDVVDARGSVIHHAPEPSWEGNVLDGHCILYLSDDRRFIDATVEQYRRLAHFRFGPIVGRAGPSDDGPRGQDAILDGGKLPAGLRLLVQRESVSVQYLVADDWATELIVAHPSVTENIEAHRRAGINLASLTLDILRRAGSIARARAAPYPRLHALLDALGEAPFDHDEAGDCRFSLVDEEGTLHQLRLDEIPLPKATPPPVGEQGSMDVSSSSVTAQRGIAGWRPWRPAATERLRPVGSERARPQLRPARSGEAGKVNRLLKLAGVELNPYLVEGIGDGSLSSALIRAAESGKEEVLRELVVAARAGDPNLAMAGLATVVVAEDARGVPVGAAVALPPFRVFADAANAGLSPPRALVGLAGVAKIKGVAVAKDARGAGIGSALVGHCTRRYLSLGYFLVYGQLRTGSGLETYYPRLGFEVLAASEAISLDALSLPMQIKPEPGEQLFTRWR